MIIIEKLKLMLTRTTCLIVCLIISLAYGCLHTKTNPPELPEKFEVTAAKMESAIDSSFHLIIGPIIGNNPRAVFYPKLKGIPDSLSNIKKYLLPLDDVQAVFQAYKAGLINKNDCLNSLRKDVNDTIQCTANYVKTFVIIVTGISKKGHKYYLFDSNNNYDLSDEPLFIMTEKISRNQPHKVLFEKFVNGKIQLDSTRIAFYGIKKTDFLLMKFCEWAITSFDLDTNALEKGSTQVNMPAIPFKGVTLKGDTVMFPKDFKGKYVLLDFWSTSCPHCIEDIRNTYRDLYKKYAGDNFEILGIADDPKNKVERFVSQNMIEWTMIPAPKSTIQESYKINVYPALYLIDPEGTIILKGQELSKEKINDVFEKYLAPN